MRQADLNEPANLVDAFEGATHLLIVSTDEMGKRSAQHLAAIEAAVRAGVTHLVYTSGPGVDPNSHNPILKEHGDTEMALAASGVKWTSLRNNMYTDGVPYFLKILISDGKLSILAGEAQPIWVSRDDCARVAALCLIDDSSLSGPVEISGSEALSFSELAGRLSKLRGEPIVPQIMTTQELTAELGAKGLPEQVAHRMVRIISWLTQGEFGSVSDTVEQITGTKPAPVDAVLSTLIYA